MEEASGRIGIRYSPARSVVVWGAAHVGLLALTNGIHTNPRAAVLLSLIVTFPFMFVSLMLISAITRIRMSIWHALLGLLVFLGPAVFYGMHGFALGVAMAIPFAAIFFGYIVAFAIREPNLLLPVAIIAGIVDIWGVYGSTGTTRMALTNHPHLARAVLIPVGPLMRVGPGDFVFLGIFLTAIQRFGMNLKGTIIVLYALLVASLLAVALFEINIPALAPMAVAVLAVNHKGLKLTRQEWFALLYAALVIGVLVALYLLTRHPGKM